MAKVVRRVGAERDLLSIFESGLAHWGASSALDYFQSFQDVWELLARHPQAGRERNEVSPGLRSWRHRSHIVYYRISGQQVIVSRILHASADSAAAAS